MSPITKTFSASTLGKVIGAAFTGAVIAAPVALAAGLASATSVAAGFEQSMANVASVTGGGAAALETLSNAARDAGATSVFSASQAGDAMYYLASAGMNTQQITQSLGSTLSLAAAGGMGLADATEIVTSTLSQFGMGADEAGRASNVMAAAAAASNTTIGQLGAGMGYVGPVAASLGMSLESTTAAMGLLANAGIKGERGGTALRSALSSLVAPSDKAAAALEGMGLSVEDVDPATHSLVEIIAALESGSMTAADAVAIFGLEAGPSMLALVSQGSGALEDMENKITGTNKAAEMAATQTETFQGALKMLGSAIEEVQIATGNEALPAMTSMVEGATAAVTALGQSMDTLSDAFGNAMDSGGSAIEGLKARLGGVTGSLEGKISFSIDGPQWINKETGEIISDKEYGQLPVKLRFDYSQVEDTETVMEELARKTHELANDIKIGETWFGSVEDLDKARNAGELTNKAYLQGITDMTKSKSQIEGSVGKMLDSFQSATEGGLIKEDEFKSIAENIGEMYETIGDSAADIVGPMEEAFEAGTIGSDELAEMLDTVSESIDSVGEGAEDLITPFTDAWDGSKEGAEELNGQLETLNSAITILGADAESSISPITDALSEGSLTAGEAEEAIKSLTDITVEFGSTAADNLTTPFQEALASGELVHDEYLAAMDTFAEGAQTYGTEFARMMGDINGIWETGGYENIDEYNAAIEAGLADLAVKFPEGLDTVYDASNESAEEAGEADGKSYGEAFLESIKGYEATFAAGRSLLTGELLTADTKRTRDEEEAYQANRAAQKPWPIYFKPEIVDVGTKSGGAMDWDVIGDMISGGARGRAISGTVTDINSLSTALETAYGSAELAAAGVVYIMEQSNKGGNALELFRENQQEAYDQWKSDNADLISSIDPASEAFADFTRQLELDWEETEFQSWVETLPVDLLTIEDFSENTQRALYDIYEGMEIPDSVERDGGIGKRIVELSEIGDEGSQKILDNINTAWSAVLNGLESDSIDPDQFNVLDGYLDYLISEGADPEKIEEIKNILGDKLNPYEVWGSPQHLANWFAENSDIIETGGETLGNQLYFLWHNLKLGGKEGWEEAWAIIFDPDTTEQQLENAIDLLDLSPGAKRIVENLRDTLGDIDAAAVFEELFTEEIPISFASMIKAGLTDFNEIFEDVGSQAVSAFNNGLSLEEAHSIADMYEELSRTDREKFEAMGGYDALEWWRGAQELLDEYNLVASGLIDGDLTELQAQLDAYFSTYDGHVTVTAEVNAFGGPLATGPVDENGNPITLASLLFGTDADRRKEIEREDLWFKNTVMPLTEDHIDKMLAAATTGYEDDYQAALKNAEKLYALQDLYGQKYLTLRENQLITALRMGEIGIMAFNDQWDKLHEKQDESKKKVDELSDKYGNLAKTTAESMDDCCEAMSEFGKAQEASTDMFFGSYIGPTENYVPWLAETGEYEKRISVGFDFPEDIDQQVAEYLVAHPVEGDITLVATDDSISESLSGIVDKMTSFTGDNIPKILTALSPPSDDSISEVIGAVGDIDSTIVPGADLNQDDLYNIVTEINETQTAIPVGINASQFWRDYSSIVTKISSWHVYIPVDVDVVANIPALASQIKAEILAGLQS